VTAVTPECGFSAQETLDGEIIVDGFAGIGGFPLIWEQLNGKGTCLWGSEIEEFPIAVTKFHFGEAEA
jgi:site-specific DNA-cytosine methylase